LPAEPSRKFSTTTCTYNIVVVQQQQVGWPNGKALDYESRDCRFDPCVDQQNTILQWSYHFVLLLKPSWSLCTQPTTST
jgi:hypothetical protein